MNKLIDSWYPVGWRWLGTLTLIAFLFTLAGSVGALLGMSALPARMMLALFILLLALSGVEIAFARHHYKTSVGCAIFALVWIVGQIIYWSPYWVAA